MSKHSFNFLVSLASVLFQMAVLSAPANPDAKLNPEPGYDQTQEVGPHHRNWEFTRDTVNDLGQPIKQSVRYTELETGMHYQENGQWYESQEVIELDGSGAVARHGQHQVRFAPNINTKAAIDLLTPDKKRMHSHILGLSYFDPLTGKSVLLAEIKDSIGEIIPPNQVIYRDAFTDIRADVRYTYTKLGLEQDVILREPLPLPYEFDLTPEFTRLDVLTEFLNPPVPKKKVHTLTRETKRRNEGVEPDFLDEHLDFGEMQIGPGKAFLLQKGQGQVPAFHGRRKPISFLPVRMTSSGNTRRIQAFRPERTAAGLISCRS